MKVKATQATKDEQASVVAGNKLREIVVSCDISSDGDGEFVTCA